MASQLHDLSCSRGCWRTLFSLSPNDPLTYDMVRFLKGPPIGGAQISPKETVATSHSNPGMSDTSLLRLLLPIAAYSVPISLLAFAE